MTAYIASGAMTSGDSGGSRPRVDKLQSAWHAPESYVILDSPGVVELDTSVVSHILGLRVRYQNVGPGATWEGPEQCPFVGTRRQGVP